MFLGALALLLLLWPVFLLPALRASGRPRTVAVLAAGLGGAALAWELWVDVFSGASAAIRLDLLAIGVVLVPVYVWAAAELWGAGWRRVGGAAGAVTLVALVGMTVAWKDVGREVARLDRARAEGGRLLFEAKFRNAESYARYFEMQEAPPESGAAFPVGHWESVGGGSLTRLVINPAGRLWAFFGGDPEFQFGDAAVLRLRGEGEEGWEAQLVYRGVGERRLVVSAPAGDNLSLTVDGRPGRFRRTAPPLVGLPSPDGLEYVGVFHSAVPSRGRIRLTQLWLWRDAEGLLAIAALDHLQPGADHHFITPLRWGRGVPTPEGYRFSWQREGMPARTALVRLVDEGVWLRLPERAERWPDHTLNPGAVIEDDVVELADRTDAAAWDYWFDQLLVGHFLSGRIGLTSSSTGGS